MLLTQKHVEVKMSYVNTENKTIIHFSNENHSLLRCKLSTDFLNFTAQSFRLGTHISFSPRNLHYEIALSTERVDAIAVCGLEVDSFEQSVSELSEHVIDGVKPIVVKGDLQRALFEQRIRLTRNRVLSPSVYYKNINILIDYTGYLMIGRDYNNGPWDCPPHILKGDYRGALYAQRQLVFLRFDNGGCVGMVDLSSNAKQTRESVLARAEREGLNWLPQSHKEWNPFAYDSWSYWLEAQRDFERIIESIEL